MNKHKTKHKTKYNIHMKKDLLVVLFLASLYLFVAATTQTDFEITPEAYPSSPEEGEDSTLSNLDTYDVDYQFEEEATESESSEEVESMEFDEFTSEDDGSNDDVVKDIPDDSQEMVNDITEDTESNDTEQLINEDIAEEEEQNILNDSSKDSALDDNDQNEQSNPSNSESYFVSKRALRFWVSLFAYPMIIAFLIVVNIGVYFAKVPKLLIATIILTGVTSCYLAVVFSINLACYISSNEGLCITSSIGNFVVEVVFVVMFGTDKRRPGSSTLTSS